MGHRKKHAPKRGSLAFLPKGRAARIYPRIRYWPKHGVTAPTLLGFMGYKAGMTHVFMVEDRPGSPNYGKEIVRPVTVIEAPPILICGVRAYTKTPYGFKTLTEAWMENPPDDLERVFTLPEKFDAEDKLKKMEENLDKIAKFRVIAVTQPRLANISKKKPEVMEIEVGGGTIQEQFEYVKGLLGKTVSPREVFKEGQFVDVIAVTKGKGWQGPVKRWGVKILPRKSRKTKRGIATLGPWKPTRVMYSIPRAGQMGFHKRTEYNKRILKIGENGKEVTPKGGFLRYGPVRSTYILINGSVPGPTKRLVRMRYPARPPKTALETPNIVYVSTESLQGK
ncbi:50S ribosomal protein L3 [Candidatus Bathyarchaeota archaeon]|nr:MAG: 50S ribosomal protein L3 [Candidatus Bathyarchaeota archaeon]RLI30121.1 MAG: 50S ribosomal protein L3 [Candidatus Bathyarchaeota archaeon]